jgi:hypothetical protein
LPMRSTTPGDSELDGGARSGDVGRDVEDVQLERPGKCSIGRMIPTRVLSGPSLADCSRIEILETP